MTLKKKTTTSSGSVSLGGPDTLINPLDPSQGRPEVDPIPPPAPVQIQLPTKDEETPPAVDDDDEPIDGGDNGEEDADPPPPVGP